MCFTCHKSGGDASSLDVQAAVHGPERAPERPRHPDLLPSRRPRAGAPATRRRPTTSSAGSATATATCADCHSPHAADSTASVQTPDGWTASGRLGRISGVSVVNSTTPGDPPTYTFIDGNTDPITLEYQLCLKCHSGLH